MWLGSTDIMQSVASLSKMSWTQSCGPQFPPREPEELAKCRQSIHCIHSRGSQALALYCDPGVLELVWLSQIGWALLVLQHGPSILLKARLGLKGTVCPQSCKHVWERKIFHSLFEIKGICCTAHCLIHECPIKLVSLLLYSPSN